MAPVLAPRYRSFDVEVSFDESEVAPQWRELEDQGTAFQTRAWVLPWYRFVAPRFGATPFFVTVRESTSRRVLMFIPLCRRRRHGLMTIEFPDIGVSDYNTALLAPGVDLDASGMQDLWENIRRALPPADLVRFEKIPATLCGRDNPFARLDWLHPTASAWTLHLPATRELYDHQVVRPKICKEHKRKRRRLTEHCGELRFLVAATPSAGERVFETLRNERRVRFHDAGRFDVLAEPCFVAFYRAVIFDEWRPFAVLSALMAGERALATQFALRHRGAYLLLMHSFDPALERLSPGIVALDEMVTHLIGAGEHCFDFTVGDEAYKRQFGVQETALLAGFCPLSSLGGLYVAVWPRARRIKRWICAFFGAWWNRFSECGRRAVSRCAQPGRGQP
jgi:CelD/BcsL family acetyltransferase involved in cellulose biosynthesis